MKNDNNEEKMWKNLKKQYFTLEQKLDFIRKFNLDKSNKASYKTIKDLKEYLKRLTS